MLGECIWQLYKMAHNNGMATKNKAIDIAIVLQQIESDDDSILMYVSIGLSIPFSL